jgi:hypothetical protein
MGEGDVQGEVDMEISASGSTLASNGLAQAQKL